MHTGEMLGGQRVVGLSTERNMTTVSAAVSPGSGLLAFDTGGVLTNPSIGAGLLYLRYGEHRLDAVDGRLNMDLSGYSALEFGIPSLVGAGEVLVHLNSHAWGTSSIRLPLTAPGTLRFPFAFVNNLSWIDDVVSLNIRLRGVTEGFEFKLDEIRIVSGPTPGDTDGDGDVDDADLGTALAGFTGAAPLAAALAVPEPAAAVVLLVGCLVFVNRGDSVASRRVHA